MLGSKQRQKTRAQEDVGEHHTFVMDHNSSQGLAYYPYWLPVLLGFTEQLPLCIRTNASTLTCSYCRASSLN